MIPVRDAIMLLWKLETDDREDESWSKWNDMMIQCFVILFIHNECDAGAGAGVGMDCECVEMCFKIIDFLVDSKIPKKGPIIILL